MILIASFIKGNALLKTCIFLNTRLAHIPTTKLLLTKRELRKLEAKIKEKGYSLVPLRIFFSDKGLAKLEIGLGKGKKIYDKRESIKAREQDRDIKRKYGI